MLLVSRKIGKAESCFIEDMEKSPGSSAMLDIGCACRACRTKIKMITLGDETGEITCDRGSPRHLRFPAISEVRKVEPLDAFDQDRFGRAAIHGQTRL